MKIVIVRHVVIEALEVPNGFEKHFKDIVAVERLEVIQNIALLDTGVLLRRVLSV